MVGDKIYTMASSAWRRAGDITILSVLGSRIARFPMGLLAACGDNSWSYILIVLSLLVATEHDHPFSTVDDGTEGRVRETEAPKAGIYRLIEQDVYPAV